jgi:hypothetical protein
VILNTKGRISAQRKMQIRQIHIEAIKTPKIMICTKNKTIKKYKAMKASNELKINTIKNIKIIMKITIMKANIASIINIKIFQKKTLVAKITFKGTNIIKISFIQENMII